MRNGAVQDKVKEKVILMLKNGKISLDEIKIFFSELSDEEIEEVKAFFHSSSIESSINSIILSS